MTAYMTLMMVTHEMGFARKVADRMIFMHQGKVHEMGPPDQLFADPRTPNFGNFSHRFTIDTL